MVVLCAASESECTAVFTAAAGASVGSNPVFASERPTSNVICASHGNSPFSCQES